MPELPEVETIVTTLAPQVVGSVMRDVEVLLPRAVQAGEDLLAQKVPGMRVNRVFRRAKLLVLELVGPGASPDDGLGPLFLVFHLKMTGRFFVHPPGTAPLKHTRLIFNLLPPDCKNAKADCRRLFFDDMRTFGYCRAFYGPDLKKWSFWAGLGPEPLETSAEVLAKSFKKRGSSIKSALLDQRTVAGVGNIYADEALFMAKIHPAAKASTLPTRKLVNLAENLKAILQRAIDECGSSIRDYRDAHGNAGAFQNSFNVYGRKDQPCVTCSAPLQGAKIAGRSTVFCPNCQTS